MGERDRHGPATLRVKTFLNAVWNGSAISSHCCCCCKNKGPTVCLGATQWGKRVHRGNGFLCQGFLSLKKNYRTSVT